MITIQLFEPEIINVADSWYKIQKHDRYMFSLPLSSLLDLPKMGLVRLKLKLFIIH